MTSTSTELWENIASSTLDLIDYTVPFFMIFFGSVIAIFVFVALLRTFEKTLRRF